MMDTDPEKRPTAAQLLECELFVVTDDSTVSVLYDYDGGVLVLIPLFFPGCIYNAPITAAGKIARA